ncbi:MAG: RNA methyltransferase [Clostridiales bacterium]|nr:RNA methyltransferase [Clostridiales bacterium]
MERITSRTNPLLGHIKKLLKDRSYRRETGEFVCDGVKLLDEALRWGAEITALICSEGLELPALPETGRLVQVPAGVMASISPMKAPQGVLFTCKQPDLTPPERLDGRTYLVLDGLQDPGNVGTIWRSADAFGAAGLLLTGHSADPYSWKTVRASMGAAFRMPAWEVTPEELQTLCRASGLPLWGTALQADTADLRQLSGGCCALAIGSEGSGLSRSVLALCDGTVKIPMEPQCESLNAAMAATVALWERYRGLSC